MSADSDAWLGSLDRYLTLEPEEDGVGCAVTGCLSEGEFCLRYDGPLYCREHCEEAELAEEDGLGPFTRPNLLNQAELEDAWCRWYGACATDDECPF